MNILVTYATRYGSTTAVAAAIADALCQAGQKADLVRIEENPDPVQYEAIILGSPLYLGKWLRSTAGFINGHKSVFASVPHAVFTVGYTLREPGPMEQASARMAELEFQHIIRPVYSGYFGGKLELAGLSAADREICQMVKLVDGDFREMTKVTAWALDALNALFPTQ